MMKRMSLISMSVIAAIVLVMTGCNNEPVTPNIGADRAFTAKAGGSSLVIEPTRIEAFYDSVTHDITISGAIPGERSTASPTRDLILRFNSDLASGSYPRTLTAPNASMTYILVSPSDTTSYMCGMSEGGSCSITINSFESPRRINGTFSGTLMRVSDSSLVVPASGSSTRADTVSSIPVTDGSFSVVLY